MTASNIEQSLQLTYKREEIEKLRFELHKQKTELDDKYAKLLERYITWIAPPPMWSRSCGVGIASIGAVAHLDMFAKHGLECI